MAYLLENNIYCGDSVELMKEIKPKSIALAFWSPPYFLGKDYEQNATYESWQKLLRNVIKLHFDVLKPGGFLVINIADILSFKDEKMSKIMGLNPSSRKCQVTKEMILEMLRKNPRMNKYQLAEAFNCSEQTIDRRLNGNNIRGGKYETGTHVKEVGGNLETYASEAGLYLYDVRIWQKDPAWNNSKWTTNTLKAVSEFEYLYVFWKPGNYIVNRARLTDEEWREWGYRQIWNIASVRANNEHPAMFPKELARRVIRLYSDEDEIVLDPFLGSGTTALAAIEAKRQFIGIELMEKYALLAKKKISMALISPPLDI